ncbi:MAG: dihydropteroate synthase [Bacteroidetes bacterium GWF2_43_63]|nr:MAG: dihydropteroate synthase [Bacteroidetes bacterium GWE2_42_42]OFY55626.1 MAG: dihydropteroate synthase [Bacteroidetes bacterium GWF2_43_63]HBG71616.1 dihydropteroate synthase [Bacteroidales bacterium]HCB62149.1 dihydropteroate synthase [Bacteroidales bacterium]HCY22377.1 dihydropteroate synthase [Bacteroidales bacterium]
MESAVKKFSLNIRGSLHEFDFPAVMGIINITPDSYFSASRTEDEKQACERCSRLISEGASMIDVGAVSTRPGSEYPGTAEEINRLMRVFPMLRKEFPDAIFSIDTSNASVARQLLDEGADIINDISAGDHDVQMLPLVAEKKSPYIMMHMRGWPKDMQSHTQYTDVVKEINDYFAAKIEILQQLGLSDVIVDPGFGFSKTTEQNYSLLKNLSAFTFHNKPLLVGISRKSMIYKALKSTPEDVLPGTIALQTIALLKGASILRVHDVAAAMQCIRVIEML